MSEPETETRPAKALRVFCETVAQELSVERTPLTDRICEKMLLRMVAQGVVVMAFPETIADQLAENDNHGLRLVSTNAVVETPDASEPILQRDPVPADGGDRAAGDHDGDRQVEEGGG